MYHKGLISIFAMPQEIDDLHLTLLNLKRNVALLPRDVDFDIDITFCLSEELTDWENTKLPMEYFSEKFQSLLPLMDWSKNPRGRVELGSEVLGCVSQRRWSLERNKDYDFTVWLDTDIFFEDRTLLYLLAGYRAALENGTPNCIVTPTFVRQWDATWDMIVADQYLSKPLDYFKEADIINDVLMDHGELSMKSIEEFKFAGGWCTLISNSILDLIGVPDSFGHYGLEDTFIMFACGLLKRNGHELNPVQFVLNNYIAGENHKHRCNKHLLDMVASRDRKDEFRQIAQENFNVELIKFKERLRLR